MSELSNNLQTAINDVQICENYADAILNGTEPKIYKELEYIQSTGTQCIDTLFFPDANTKLEMKFCKTDNIAYNWEAPFGVRDKGYDFVYWDKAEGSATTKATEYGATGYTTWAVTPTNYNIDTNITLDKGVYTLEWNGNTATKTVSTATGISSISLFLFSNRNSGGSLDSPMIMKLYYCKIYSVSNELVRDFIPARNLLTNEIGLYDKIENKWYYNVGTGNFIAGPDKEDEDVSL